MPRFTYIRRVAYYYACIIEAPDAEAADDYARDLSDYEMSPDGLKEVEHELVECDDSDAEPDHILDVDL